MSASDLRQRINQLREEIAAATIAYRLANDQGRSDRVRGLLKKRAELFAELMETQKQLFHTFRSTPLNAETEPAVLS
ncbi:MAG: hypothetical protein U1G07_08315 [Verrucomicrobiota bacterium]